MFDIAAERHQAIDRLRQERIAEARRLDGKAFDIWAAQRAAQITDGMQKLAEGAKS